MSMQDLIKKLKERPHAEQPELQEWKEALESLFDEVEAWLAPAVSAGVLTVRRSESTIAEQDFGEYPVPVLEISDSKVTIRLEPVGALVVAVVASKGLQGLRGRVNLVCGPIVIPLVRTAQGSWKAVPRRGEPCDLNEGSFASILTEVLL